MTRPILKICGIREAEHLALLAELQVDYAGLVAHEASPRHLPPTDYADVMAARPKKLATVLVTVADDPAWLNPYLSVALPDMLQLHGETSPEAAMQLKQRWRCGIIKAIPLAMLDAWQAWQAWQGVADMLIFDAPATATMPGGMGMRFPWHWLKDAPIGLPWLVAGGIGAETVQQALAQSGAMGVDASSALEEPRGTKSVEKIKEFVLASRL